MSSNVRRYVDELVTLGAASLPHSGASMLLHLIGTHEILEAWRAPEPWRLAGLYHAVYGTTSFGDGLLVASPSNREHIMKVIGADAERIVYSYSLANSLARADSATVNIAVANAAEQYVRGNHAFAPSLYRSAGREDLLAGAREFLRKCAASPA